MARPKINDPTKMSKRTLARRKKERGESRTYPIHRPNESFFDKWSPELAWIIGIIWTDGNLYKNTIEVCSKDSDLIEFVDFLTDANNIKLKNNGKHLRTYFTSVKVASFLKKLGLTEHKSFTVKWPNGLPHIFEGHFMRGVIDGDGWISLRQDRPNQYAPDLTVGICTASKNFFEDIKKWFDKNHINYNCRKWNTTWRIEIREQQSCRNLYTLIYPCGTTECGLIRKSATYWYWINHTRLSPGRPKKFN